MTRTFDDINDKIKSGNVAVFTAEEVVAMCREMGVKETYKKVDVVTCATFGPMCSSGAFLNFGHADPPIRMCDITLNKVPVSGGLAAVDTYVGATQGSKDRPMTYGGAHVIEDLIAGKKVKLKAESYGTDCYPRKDVVAEITLDNLNQAYIYNPRNAYQNYAAATNSSKKSIHTYMGTLLPNYGNVTYSTSGELSPLLKDPKLRTIGVGTRIFLGGAQGYVTWQGTQFTRGVTKYDDGADYSGATIAVIGDMKNMSTRYIKGAVLEGYGVSMFVGIGIPIPVLDEDLLYDLSRPNEELYTQFVDYSTGERSRPNLGRVNYAQLRSGKVELNGKTVTAAPMSSLYIAREIATILKGSIAEGEFTLNQPVEMFPNEQPFKPLKVVGGQS